MAKIDIDKLIEPIQILYEALDTELFLSILSELNIDIRDGGSQGWLEEMINKTNKVSIYNARILEKYKRLLIPAISKLKLHLNTTGQITDSITNILNRFERYATSLVEYTNTQCLQSSNVIYRRIVNTAYLDVETGLRTFEQSVTRATKLLADAGIKIQSYESGSVINVHSGVARQIRTQSAHVAREIQESYAEDFDLNLYEVSSHAGARPLCYPWQGKIISQNNSSGTVKDVNGNSYKYYSESETTIGEPAGLFGINCTHMKYYIQNKLFTKTFDTYKKAENDIIYEYDQKVAYMKNEIRKEKRRLEGFKSTNNKLQETISKQRLKEKNKKLRELQENLPLMEKLAKKAINKS